MRADGVAYLDVDGAVPSRSAIEQQPFDPVAAVKGRYKHFMLKEIHEQPDGALDAVRGRYLIDPPRVELAELPFEPREQVRASSAWC